jgi:signal transduction histidine kinase
MTTPTRTYVDTQLFIDGQWQDAADGRSLPVFNPATGAEIGRVAHAGKADLDKAVAAACKGFETWRDMTPAERSKIMRKAAALVRERAAQIAPLLTQENGKPLPEARVEVMAAADITEWFAEEGFRVYGRIVPPRANLAIRQMVLNLVSNAIKYTPKGRVLVGCRKRGDSVVIEVWDTGLGIPADKQKSVFREFERLAPAARTASGLGLGLSIVERLSRVMRHKVSLSSEPGRGSVFRIEAPWAVSGSSAWSRGCRPARRPRPRSPARSRP